MRAYVDTLISACRDDEVAYGLLTIWSIESQSGESAGRVLAWLRANHDFTDDELEWFVVHSEDEDDHAAEGIALVRRLALDLPDFPERAPQVVTRICDAWLVLHDYYRGLLRAPAAAEGVALATAPIVKAGEHLAPAVEVLKGGGLVISPTTTNYNILCDATNPDAVARVFQVKERVKVAPLPVSLPEPG